MHRNLKIYILIALSIILYPFGTYSQVLYSPKVDSLINLVSTQSILKFAKELTGDTTAIIGGSPYRILSRYVYSPHKVKAAQYIYEKFQSYGLNTRYQVNGPNSVNVIGVKTGTKYPFQYYLITAHYDNIILYNPENDTIQGADDNASGVCGVLEAARILNGFNTDYSVMFVAFDHEEIAPPGSLAFVDSAFARGDTLKSTINLDMIGYDGNNDNKFMLGTDTNSYVLVNHLVNTVQLYLPGMQYYIRYNYVGSDEHSFWFKKYKAILLMEDYDNDFTPHYHKKTDKVGTLNLNYFTKMVKAGFGTLASLAAGSYALIEHTSLLSCPDTTQRLTIAVINYPYKAGSGVNAPRLYYKTWNNPYSYLNPVNVIQNRYVFTIPGQPRGTKVSYYIAFQDSSGSFLLTSPAGGSGVNPPGTTPPPQVYTYYVWQKQISYSSTVPKTITPLQQVKDTIHISQNGTVADVNVTLNISHQNDGDLILTLRKLSNYSNLAQYNGNGGQNFTNTVFDDSASISITQGTPPFTGRFKPLTPLSNFNGSQLNGGWVLVIYDKGNTNSGTLLNWNLEIEYSPSVSVGNLNLEIPSSFSLSQNYPNPFNNSTIITFGLKKNTSVKIVLYDVTGKEQETLVDGYFQAGTYKITSWLGDYPSGVYFYKLHAGDYTETKRMILIK